MLKKIMNSATLMTWATITVRFGSFFFVLPLIVTVYNDAEKSFYFFIFTFTAMAMLFDSGFGSVLVRAVAYFKAGSDFLPTTREEFNNAVEPESKEPNKEKLQRLMSTTNVIYIIIGVVVAIMMSTIGFKMTQNLIEQSGNTTGSYVAYILLVCFSVISVVKVKWISFMRGLNYVAKEAKIATILDASRVVVFLILLSFRLKPLFLVLGFLVQGIVHFIYVRNFVLKWYKENNIILLKKTYFDKSIFQSIWPATWKLAGIFWGNYMVEYSDSIIMAQISDTSLMANFFLTKQFLRPILGYANAPLYANIPTIYECAVKKKMDVMKRIASKYILMGLLIMITGVLAIYLFGNRLLDVLGADDKIIPATLLFLMSATMLLDLHSSFHAGIYTSTNHIPFLIPSLVSGAIIIYFGFKLQPVYGLYGVLMLRFLVQLSFNNWYATFLSLKLLKWPFYKYIYEFPIIGTKGLIIKIKEYIKYKK